MEKGHYYLFRRLLDCSTFLSWFVKVDTPKGLVPWKMDGYQKNLVRDYSRNRAINKSKKTGISTTLAGEALHHAYTMPGRQKALVSTGQRIAGELLGKFYDEYDTIPFPLQVNLGGHRSAERVEFPNKARIFSLPSGDPDKIRGLGLRGTATDVVLDEFAFAPNDKQLWLVIRDFQRFGGRITINSTPKGKRGKYYEICAPLQAVYRGAPYQPTEWSYHEIHFTRCERLRTQEKSLREDIDEIEFNEEYCCEFQDESMSFFPYEMIWAAQKVERYIDNGGDKPIYFGIDFGKSVGETVVIVVEEYDTEKFRVIWIEPMGGIDYTEQLEAIKQLSETYNPICINVDASGPGGQTIYDFLQKEESLASKVWGFNFDPKFKEKIIIRTRMLMSRGRLLLPVKNLQWAEVLETQLHQVQRKTTMSGEGTRYTGKVEGRNDDYAWSLALAVWKEFMLEQKEIFFSSQPDEGLKIIENAGKGGSLWA